MRRIILIAAILVTAIAAIGAIDYRNQPVSVDPSSFREVDSYKSYQITALVPSDPDRDGARRIDYQPIGEGKVSVRRLTSGKNPVYFYFEKRREDQTEITIKKAVTHKLFLGIFPIAVGVETDYYFYIL